LKNIKEWLVEAQQQDGLIGFIIFDVDYFKEVNDQYGHLAGDDVLKRIAYEANLCLANYNSFLARYGGDEFIAILKVENFKKKLQSIVENLHKHLTSLVIEVNDQKIPIHISIGVSTNYRGMITDEKKIFKLADDALYKSKRNGRNQYTVN
jgi:diguanylate cyclase (GGDEF) domain